MTEEQFDALVRLIRTVAKATFIKGMGGESSESEEIEESIIDAAREDLVDDWRDLV